MQQQQLIIQSYTVDSNEAWAERTYSRTFYTLLVGGRPRGRLIHPGTIRSLLAGEYIEETERQVDEHGTVFVTFALTERGRAWRPAGI